MSTFDERAREWDTPERQARAEIVAAAIRDAVSLTPDTRAIDLGAGTGLLGIALASHVGEVVPAAPSAGMLEVANEKLSAAGQANVSAVRFDLLADQAPGDPFDLVVSLLVLHHLEDTSAALTAIAGLLRPGGRLALADLDTEDGTFHSADAEGIHHLGFDREHLGELARSAGFADVEFRTATTMEDDGRRYPLFLLVARRP
jgi:2-polyprenyl-3-methyl-5-hydroxy-6-metoxy-1,4-benzoquinol methylase